MFWSTVLISCSSEEIASDALFSVRDRPAPKTEEAAEKSFICRNRSFFYRITQKKNHKKDCLRAVFFDLISLTSRCGIWSDLLCSHSVSAALPGSLLIAWRSFCFRRSLLENDIHSGSALFHTILIRQCDRQYTARECIHHTAAAARSRLTDDRPVCALGELLID